MLALTAAFLGWLFDGFEIGLFPVVARPALLSMLGPGGEGDVGLWMGRITAAFLIGAALGAVILGLAETYGLAYAPTYSVVFTFGILVLVLAFRPRGILGKAA